jgi:isopenicillin N synthase-like dioxygenase
MSEPSLSLPAEFADEVIPILDLGPFLAGEDGALERLAGELRYAQENVGFYFAVNHGVPRDLIDRAHANLRRFFALADEEKRKHKNYLPPKSTIYVSSTVNENTKPDLNEMLRIVRERPADHPAIQAGFSSHGPNHWPDETLLPGWKAEMLEYYDAMEALGYSLLPVYARALDLRSDYFDGLFDDPVWTTRNQHYPAAAAEENQFGIAPHRDHGFLTLLPVTEEPGLQIQATSGRWLPANTIDGAMIVNTGEFLNRWTNGRFLATPHRVVPTGRDRYSIAFFFNPSWDTVADPLASCTGPDNPPRFKPVRLLDYREWYINQNFLDETGKSRPEPPSVEESTLEL